MAKNRTDRIICNKHRRIKIKGGWAGICCWDSFISACLERDGKILLSTKDCDYCDDEKQAHKENEEKEKEDGQQMLFRPFW